MSMDVFYRDPTNFDTFLTTFVQGFWTYVNLRIPKNVRSAVVGVA